MFWNVTPAKNGNDESGMCLHDPKETAGIRETVAGI